MPRKAAPIGEFLRVTVPSRRRPCPEKGDTRSPRLPEKFFSVRSAEFRESAMLFCSKLSGHME